MTIFCYFCSCQSTHVWNEAQLTHQKVQHKANFRLQSRVFACVVFISVCVCALAFCSLRYVVFCLWLVGAIRGWAVRTKMKVRRNRKRNFDPSKNRTPDLGVHKLSQISLISMKVFETIGNGRVLSNQTSCKSQTTMTIFCPKAVPKLGHF